MAGENTTQMCESTRGSSLSRLIAHGIMQPFSTLELLLKAGVIERVEMWVTFGHDTLQQATPHMVRNWGYCHCPFIYTQLASFPFPILQISPVAKLSTPDQSEPIWSRTGSSPVSWVRVLLHNNPMIWQSVWRQVALSAKGWHNL